MQGPTRKGDKNHSVGLWKYFLMPQNGIGHCACGNHSTGLVAKRSETKGQVWLLSSVRFRRIFMGLVILSSRVRGSRAASPRAKVPGNVNWVPVGPGTSAEQSANQATRSKPVALWVLLTGKETLLMKFPRSQKWLPSLSVSGAQGPRSPATVLEEASDRVVVWPGTTSLNLSLLLCIMGN